MTTSAKAAQCRVQAARLELQKLIADAPRALDPGAWRKENANAVLDSTLNTILALWKDDK